MSVENLEVVNGEVGSPEELDGGGSTAKQRSILRARLYYMEGGSRFSQ